MSDFIIPIGHVIKDFKIHLDSHPRTILSAKFGDGKSFFLNKLAIDEMVGEEYAFITIHPVNYQILDNKDILELIKRDILAQMLMNNMIEPEYDISKEELLYYYIKSNGVFALENIFTIISQLGFEADLISAFIAGCKGVKFIKSIINEVAKIKNNQDTVSKIDMFIENVDTSTKIYEEDIYTKIIRDNIRYYQETYKRKVVLVVEDMDRLDPAHLFRIMNVFSAHLDYCYNYGSGELPSCDNKFNFDNIVFVLDYGNTKKIYEHFYGASTDFEGYIHKFSSKGYYEYSLRNIRNEYVFSLISNTVDVELELVKAIVPLELIEKNSIRKIVQSCDAVDKQIYPQKKLVIKETEYELHPGILRVFVIMRRLGYTKDETIKPMLDICKTNICNLSNNKMVRLFFAYALGYLYMVDELEMSNSFYYNFSMSYDFTILQIIDIDEYGIVNFKYYSHTNHSEGVKLIRESIVKFFDLISN